MKPVAAPSPAPFRHTNGFTLPEMLVSLAVLGLMSSMLLAGLQTAGKLSLRTARIGSSVEAIATVQTIARAKLERLQAIVRLDGVGTNVDAQGDGTSFSFVAPPQDRDAPNAPRRFRIALSASNDLTLYSANNLSTDLDGDDRNLIGWKPFRLIPDVASLSIAYLGPDKLSGDRRWQANWFDRPQPPDAIRIRVGFEPGDPRVWPDLIVHPRATANSMCRIDEASGRCGNTT